VLEGIALDPGEAVTLGPGCVDVVVLEAAAIGQQLLVGLARVERGLVEGFDSGDLQGLLDPRVCPEAVRTLSEGDVQLHVRQRRFPHAVEVLGAQRLEVEVPVSVVGGSTSGATVLQQVDGGKIRSA